MLIFRQRGPELIWASALQLFVVVIVVGLSTGIAFAQTPTAEIRTQDGLEIAGTLLDVTIDQLKVETGGGAKTIELEQIAAIEFPESAKAKLPEKAAKFQLLDGSAVFIDKYNFADGKIEATLATGQTVSISKRNVSSIVFPGDRAAVQKQVDQIKRDASITADTLVVIRNENFNAIEGIVKKFDQGNVEFAIDDQAATIPTSKLSAITFFKAGKSDYSAPLATCILSDTSRVKVRGFKLENKQFALTSLTGDVFSVDFANVVSLEFDSTESVLLTELEPSTNDWKPLLADTGIVGKLKQLRLARINQSFTGQPLSLEFPRPVAEFEAGKSSTTTREFGTGIAVQGGGRLAWRLDGDYQSLSGLIGFAPEASEYGSVKVRMLVDGDVVFEQELTKKTMTEPEAFEIDLIDKNRMILEIDYADGRSIGDMIHLVNLTLQK